MNSSDTHIFRVDETSDLPIWSQLRNRFAYLIRTGYFQPGEQLPSVRSLAADARINYNTVTKAYRDLELSGMIASIRGRGMFVRGDYSASSPEAEAADALLDDCIRQYRSQGMSYKDIAEHISEHLSEMENKTIQSDREKSDYGIIQPRQTQ